MKYFFTKTLNSHLNEPFHPLLIKNYLVSEDFQMRQLISKPKDFENKHTHEVRFCRDNKQMLFRAKYKDAIKLYIAIKQLAFGTARKTVTDFLKM